MADRDQIGAALEAIERELRTELPLHMRAFARAHIFGRTPPAAPLVARLASTLECAIAACGQPALHARGLALLRLVVPIAIEDDPRVAAARARTPSWEGLIELARARDAAAQSRFGITAIKLLHVLHGIDAAPGSESSASVALGPAIDDWYGRAPSAHAARNGDTGACDQPPHPHDGAAAHRSDTEACDPDFDAAQLQQLWDAVAANLQVTGSVRIERAPARSRTFVIEPGRDVVVVSSLTVKGPAARFEVLHELGHAAAALVQDAGVPRALDEAAAAYVARMMEAPTWLSAQWSSELAASARQRRHAIALLLDGIERALPELPRTAGSAPPWAMWNDPGAQASYVAAETIADRWHRELGSSPARGDFARALASERDRIDRAARLHFDAGTRATRSTDMLECTR